MPPCPISRPTTTRTHLPVRPTTDRTPHPAWLREPHPEPRSGRVEAGRPTRPTEAREATMLVAFSVAPSGTGRSDGSVHDAVAAAVQVVRASGLPHRTTSMFTEIEGEW